MDEAERLARLMAARYYDPDTLVYTGELEKCELGYILPKPTDGLICRYWERFLGAGQVMAAEMKKRDFER